MSERQPALRPTEPATLVVAALAGAATGWLLISNLYQDMPPLGWPPVLILAGLAALEAAIAPQVWSRIQRAGRGREAARPGVRGPVDPLVVARLAVLAKASSLAAALFGGFFAGLLPWLVIESRRLTAASDDLPPAIGGLVTSAALLAAALWLERACRVPPSEDEKRDGSDRDGE